MRSESITVLLSAARDGRDGASDRLFTAVYDELRALARSNRRRWHGNETMNTTALIHEAFLKLSGSENLDWQNRTHFYATASKAMRQILISYATRANAAKRGGKAADLSADDLPLMSQSTAEDLLLLTQLLEPLEADSPRRCRVVECRVFGGMGVRETATALGISPATVKRDWQIASAWLRLQMQESSDAPGRD